MFENIHTVQSAFREILCEDTNFEINNILNFIHRKVAHTIYSTQYKKVKKQTVTHAYTHTPRQTYKHVASIKA